MAEHFLALIPVDPHAELPDTAEALRDTLADMLGTGEARVKDYGKLQFIDCGQNFRAVHCPACTASISMSQWHAWMDEDWHGAEGFHLHRHVTSCCNQETTLNKLTYDAPQGFAHWFVAARTAKAQTLSPDQLATLTKTATLPLKPILQSY